MTLAALSKAPFPWFGGKRRAAPAVWAALGDVDHYVEPFAGSLAVLLERPHEPNRTYHSETVNDLDAMIVNFWRAIQSHPDATAEAASWPVSEFDKHARSCTLLAWRESEAGARLAGDATWCDPLMAGWWVWCVSVQIGAWGAGGPWWPDETGRLRKRGQGVPANRPHLSDDGQGVNHAGTREPGLGSADSEIEDGFRYHQLTMPEAYRWFRYLSARLRHVRILNGDWTRAVTNGASKILSVRQGGHVGIFLDPPYGDVGRASLYGKHESLTVAKEVRAWAVSRGADRDTRIVYAGYDEEGAELEHAGWSAVEWFTARFLTGGMGNVGGKHQQHRERLWLSPHCLQPAEDPQAALFDFTEASV